MKQMINWILVADRSKARVLQAPLNNGWPFSVQAGFIHPAGRLHRSDLESDFPGSFNLQGKSRSAPEPHEDIDLHEARKFALQLCEYLDKACHEQLFDRLIVVAPPRFLGILRQQFSPQLNARLVGEFNRDLASLTDSQLQTHLVAFLSEIERQPASS